MRDAINKHKETLNLSEIESEFYDFVIEMLQLQGNISDAYIIGIMRPWFSVEGIDEEDIYTQYFGEYVHQKYRIALEFCCMKAGLPDVVDRVMLDNELVLVSFAKVWLQGQHPGAIRWMISSCGDIVAEGREWPGAMRLGNLGNWLTTHTEFIISEKAKNEERRNIQRGN